MAAKRSQRDVNYMMQDLKIAKPKSENKEPVSPIKEVKDIEDKTDIKKIEDVKEDIDDENVKEKISEPKKVTVQQKEIGNPVQKTSAVEDISQIAEPDIPEITPREGTGRPKVYGKRQGINLKLTQENYEKARKWSGVYGGMTAYINALIENDKREIK